MGSTGHVFGIYSSEADVFGRAYVTGTRQNAARSPVRELVYMDLNRARWFGSDTTLTSDVCAVLLERLYGYARAEEPEDRRSVIWIDLGIELRDGDVGELETLLQDASLHREELRLDMLPLVRPLSDEARARLAALEDQEIWSKPFQDTGTSGADFAEALLTLWDTLPEVEQERILKATKIRERPN